MQKEIPASPINVQNANMLVLLIDTCGSESSLALANGGSVLAQETLPARTASAELLPAIHRLLETHHHSIHNLHAIGVISGPGSFTGVRVGLAAAKGLCEALSIPLAAVSRLAVLSATAKLTGGFAILDAGRNELYVREVHAQTADREFVLSRDAFAATANGRTIITADPSLAAALHATPCTISARDALPLVLRQLAEGGSDIATTDANYVRGESQLYAQKAASGA